MSEDDVTLSMPIPLDSDGFLRRECPTCEREFKWLHTPDQEGSSQSSADGGYFCPYCGVQAPGGSWLTGAQVALAQNMVATETIGPMLSKFANLRYDPPDKLDPLTEVDDMIRVDFECHPSEPVKVLDDWTTPARCLICGEPNR